MKDFCALFVAVSSIFFGSWYALKIRNKKATPTVSTWLLFLAGCSLGFWTYVKSQNWDLKSGILNTVDLVYVSVVLFAIFRWGNFKPKFTLLQKILLFGSAIVFIYGMTTGDTWKANVATQLLMSVAYGPMLRRMFKEKRNIESYFGWAPAAVNAFVALYPAMQDGNILSVVYAVRALFFSLLTITVMAYYDRKTKQKQALSQVV